MDESNTTITTPAAFRQHAVHVLNELRIPGAFGGRIGAAGNVLDQLEGPPPDERTGACTMVCIVDTSCTEGMVHALASRLGAHSAVLTSQVTRGVFTAWRVTIRYRATVAVTPRPLRHADAP